MGDLNHKRGPSLSASRAALVVIATTISAITVLLLSLYVFGKSESDLAQCPAGSGRSSTPGKEIELQANKARPSFSIALADQSGAVDDISLSPKQPTALPSQIQAYLIEYPRSGGERSSAEIKVVATPAAGGTVVQLKACIKRGDLWEAGTYEGTIRIFGNGIVAFDYPLILTERWPWEAAVSLLVVALAVFLLVTIYSGSLTFRGGSTRHGATMLGLVIAAAAITPTFFGTYWNNTTWGSDPSSQVSGLVVAGFTAAVAGLALSHRLLHHDDEGDPQDPPQKPPPGQGQSEAQQEHLGEQDPSEAGLEDR